MKAKQLALAALFTALMILGAFIRIPMPVGPAFTLQVLFCFLCALMLPPQAALLSMGAYLLLGLIGVPCFSFGGGISSFLQPSFGFLAGFLVCAPLSSYLKKRFGDKLRPLPAALCACGVGLVVLYILGCVYGYIIMHAYLGNPIGVWNLLWSFCIIFIPADLIKIYLAALLSARLSKALQLE